MNEEHLTIKYSRGADEIRAQYQYYIYLTMFDGYESVIKKLLYIVKNTCGGDFKLQSKLLLQEEHILCLYHDTVEELQKMIDAFFLTLHGFNIGIDTARRKLEQK